MCAKKNIRHQMFELHISTQETTKAKPPGDEKFILQDLSGDGREQFFDTFEQVMDFLLDELLEEVPQRSKK